MKAHSIASTRYRRTDVRNPRALSLARLVALTAVASMFLAALPASAAGPFTPLGPRPDLALKLRADYNHAGTRVLPRPEVWNKIRPKTATFLVTYNGFTPEAEAAFQHAVDIWEQLITSSVPIRIEATWEALDPGVLGGAGANMYWTNEVHVFPDALADAMAGVDQGGGAFDIFASFNSALSGGFSWYLGTDANPAVNQFDLATVVLHEIGHGLGFSGLMSVQGGFGFRLFTEPSIYASFTEDLAGNNIIATYADFSTQMADVLQSGNVFFDGPMAVAANGGDRPELYAPAIWEGGSSFSHLDENVFPPGDDDALMTPFLALGEAAHDPGPITLCLFQDLGWTTSANCTGEMGTNLKEASDLIVPGFEVDVANPTGPTTFFAVRNTSDSTVDVDVNYYGDQITSSPLRTDELNLGPRQTATVNVRSDLTDLNVAGNFATGLILIKESGVSTGSLEGDFFRLDQANAFATGDRLVKPDEDLCVLQEIRFVEFGSGSEFRILLDDPQGAVQPSFSYTAYDQQGNEVHSDSYSTSDHLVSIDVTELGFNDPFGTVVFDFTNSGSGWVSAKYSAFGLFSVELNSACRD